MGVAITTASGRRIVSTPEHVHFAGYRAGHVELPGGRPKDHESSSGTHRSFCGRCGTLISFEDEKHDWVSRRLRWLDVADGLPRHEKSSIPRP